MLSRSIIRNIRPSRFATRSYGVTDINVNAPTENLDLTAKSAYEKSCYLKINWKISEEARVDEAIQRMVANKIGCLAVTKGPGDDGEVIGVFSERDYIGKVALLNRSPKETKVAEVSTYGVANLVSVTLDNPVDACMKKMLGRDIRHLLIREKNTGKIVGMLSIKDLVKCVVAKHDAVVHRLHDIVLTSEIIKQI
jgi:CBS domain-containing protein